jgi:hypothetical protein
MFDRRKTPMMAKMNRTYMPYNLNAFSMVRAMFIFYREGFKNNGFELLL